jgi:hypothetical protein
MAVVPRAAPPAPAEVAAPPHTGPTIPDYWGDGPHGLAAQPAGRSIAWQEWSEPVAAVSRHGLRSLDFADAANCLGGEPYSVLATAPQGPGSSSSSGGGPPHYLEKYEHVGEAAAGRAAGGAEPAAAAASGAASGGYWLGGPGQVPSYWGDRPDLLAVAPVPASATVQLVPAVLPATFESPAVADDRSSAEYDAKLDALVDDIEAIRARSDARRQRRAQRQRLRAREVERAEVAQREAAQLLARAIVSVRSASSLAASNRARAVTAAAKEVGAVGRGSSVLEPEPEPEPMLEIPRHPGLRLEPASELHRDVVGGGGGVHGGGGVVSGGWPPSSSSSSSSSLLALKPVWTPRDSGWADAILGDMGRATTDASNTHVKGATASGTTGEWVAAAVVAPEAARAPGGVGYGSTVPGTQQLATAREDEVAARRPKPPPSSLETLLAAQAQERQQRRMTAAAVVPGSPSPAPSASSTVQLRIRPVPLREPAAARGSDLRSVARGPSRLLHAGRSADADHSRVSPQRIVIMPINLGSSVSTPQEQWRAPSARGSADAAAPTSSHSGGTQQALVDTPSVTVAAAVDGDASGPVGEMEQRLRAMAQRRKQKARSRVG